MNVMSYIFVWKLGIFPVAINSIKKSQLNQNTIHSTWSTLILCFIFSICNTDKLSTYWCRCNCKRFKNVSDYQDPVNQYSTISVFYTLPNVSSDIVSVYDSTVMCTRRPRSRALSSGPSLTFEAESDTRSVVSEFERLKSRCAIDSRQVRSAAGFYSETGAASSLVDGRYSRDLPPRYTERVPETSRRYNEFERSRSWGTPRRVTLYEPAVELITRPGSSCSFGEQVLAETDRRLRDGNWSEGSTPTQSQPLNRYSYFLMH